MRCYCGIDPGAGGAIAIIDGGLDVMVVEDWPGDKESAAFLFLGLYLEYQPYLTCLEHVTAMPKQGVNSTFKLGANLGAWQGIQLDLSASYRLLRPRELQTKSTSV